MRSRASFNAEFKVVDSPARKQGWQRHYLRGTTVTQKRAEEHQTALTLAEFEDARGPIGGVPAVLGSARRNPRPRRPSTARSKRRVSRRRLTAVRAHYRGPPIR